MLGPTKTLFKASLLCCALLGSSLFVSCASTKSAVNTAKSSSAVYVTNTKKIHVLSPEYMDEELDAIYDFSADFGDQNLSALSYVFVNGEEISMNLMTPFGADIGSLYYDGGTVSFSLPIKVGIKGEYIVADLQNIFYPAQYLAENYSSVGLDFVESTDGDRTFRTISSGKKVVEKIEIDPDKIVLENVLRGYTYTLKAVDE